MRSCGSIRGGLLFAVLAGSAAAGGQTILRVDADAGPGGDGASWATAYTDLQLALAAAGALVSQGHTVELWVAAGTYRPDGGTGDRLRRFELRDDIALYGGFSGIETFREQRDSNPATNGTVLSGDLLGDDGPAFAGRGDNSYNVVSASGTNETSVLDGFRVRGGHANGAGQTASGGGIYLRNTQASIRNCAIEDNWALNSGGGVFVLADFGNASPAIAGCWIGGNAANYGGGAAATQSGAGAAATPLFIGCEIIANAATVAGGGVGGPGAFMQVLVELNSAAEGGGMHLQRGNLTLFDCDVRNNTATGAGGGLCIARLTSTTASADLAGVRFEDNDAQDGAGLYANITFVMTECQFRRNVAGHQGGAMLFDAYVQPNGEHAVVSPVVDTLIVDGNAAARGAAAAVVHAARVQFIGCRFFSNTATERGGGIETDWNGTGFAPQVHARWCEFRWNTAPYGGAIYNYATASYLGCDFIHNAAAQDGGAVYATQVFSPVFVYCRFHGNVADRNGGGIYNINATVLLDNCELAGNRAGAAGGGLAGATASSDIRNCTLTGNVGGGDFGGGVHHPGLGLALWNSIVWGNNPERIYAVGDTFDGTVRYSCIAGGAPGAGVFDAHPHFVRSPSAGGDGWGDDPTTPEFDESLNDDFGDLRLQANSPCIDAGDNAAVPDDVLDVDLDGDTAEPLAWDLFLEPRFHDDSGAPDTGVGPPPVADIGAAEFQRTSRVAGDTNCDGRVDFFDIDPFLLALFDPAAHAAGFPACVVNADANRDGLVNFFDIDPFVAALIP